MKNIFKGIIAIIIYITLTFFLVNIFNLFNIDFSNYSLGVKLFLSLGSELLIIAIISLIFNKTLIEDWKDLKKNNKEYLKKYLKYWLLALGLMFITNIIITIAIPGAIAKNQEAADTIFKIAPLYMYTTAVIIAPFLEEFAFRLSIRNIIKNNTLFIIISGLAFGFAHVIGTYENWYDLLYIIPYSIPGIMFAYVYTKSKNIFVPVGLHLIHNGLMMVLEILVYLFI